jgi:LPXTG-motif cell wall-anchored protein
LIKRIALLVIIFVLSLSASALAAEPGSGVIEGSVVNRTEGGSSVASQDITLKTYLNEAEVDSTTTQIDAEGHFVFDGLSLESDYSYQVTLTFQEAEYYSEWLSFDEGETSKATEVTVYDAITSSEAIRVAMAHTIIYVEPESLQVVEYYLFVNEADRTYIGSKEVTADGTKETLRFSLPTEATELQPGSGLMECCIYSSEDGFVDSMPVLPGGREVIYAYKVSYNSGSYIFSPRVNYPIDDYDILVQGEGTKVTSDQLITEGPLDMEGILFQHVSGSDLVPGSTPVVSISGLPQTDNQGTVLWVIVALVVLVGGFGFSYQLRKKRFQPVRAGDSLDQKKQKLLIELAQLDDDFEDGKIPEEVYHRLRVEKKAQLVELKQMSKREERR